MKLTKTEFKGIIKDCIKELIKEGAFSDVLRESVQEANITNSNSTRIGSKELISKKSSIDSAKLKNIAAQMAGYNEFVQPEFQSNNPIAESVPMNQNLVKLVEATSTQLGKGDSNAANAYAAIFADTAMNTLPQQMAQDPSRNGGYGAMAAAGMQGVQEKVAPQELQAIAPSGDVSHWAKLAFGKYNK